MNNSRFRQRNREEDYMAGPGDATPWHILKQGTGEQQPARNVEDMSDDDQDESEYFRQNRQKTLKQRDENYRKFLIEESKREAAKWDEFSDTEVPGKANPEKAKSAKPEKEKPAKANKKRKAEEETEVAADKPETAQQPPADEDQSETAKQPPAKVPKFKPAKEPVKPRPKLLKKKKKNSEKAPVAGPVLYTPYELGNPSLTCLGCRESGHRLKNCPKFRTTICIRCGGSDHKYQECPTKGGDFKFATCFVCKEMVSWGLGILITITSNYVFLPFQGHLSKQCPKNANGVYPNGGACRYCNSTDHLAQDCRQKKRENRKPGGGDRRGNKPQGRDSNRRKGGGNFKQNQFNKKKNFQNKKRKV